MSKWRSRGFVQDSEDEDEDSGKSQNINNDRLTFRRAATAPIDIPSVRGANDSVSNALQDNNHVAVKSGTRNELRVELSNNESDTEDELAHAWPTQELPSHDANTGQGHGNEFIPIDEILPPQSSCLLLYAFVHFLDLCERRTTPAAGKLAISEHSSARNDLKRSCNAKLEI